MNRRNFILGAAAMLMFPEEAFAKTIVRTERSFAKMTVEEAFKDLETIRDNIEKPEINPATMPEIIDRDLILITDDMTVRESTKRIIVHHTGTVKDRDMSAREAHLLHKYEFEWAGIGYHYMIRKNGLIEAGRPENLTGAHAYGNNKDSVGIALAGNFELADPTDAQIESLVKLVAGLRNKYSLPIWEKGVVIGHRDVNDTKCPGENLYYMLDYVRNNAL